MALIVGSLVLLAMILFPPYFAMKEPLSEGKHTGIGYHPIWAPPQADYAYKILNNVEYDQSTGIGLSDYSVRFNKVLFVFEIVILILSSGALIFLFSIIRKAKQRDKDRSG